MPSTPEFIKKELSKDDVYDMWLSQIDNLERSTISHSIEDRTALDNSLNLGFQLFSIIDSVSYNLFGKNGRHYLKELGYTDQGADLIFTIFRNGQMHNTQSYKLVYEDGEITWGLMSGSGSGGFTPHFPGYIILMKNTLKIIYLRIVRLNTKSSIATVKIFQYIMQSYSLIGWLFKSVMIYSKEKPMIVAHILILSLANV